MSSSAQVGAALSQFSTRFTLVAVIMETELGSDGVLATGSNKMQKWNSFHVGLPSGTGPVNVNYIPEMRAVWFWCNQKCAAFTMETERMPQKLRLKLK